MSRDKMLDDLQSIKEPLIYLTAFSDGVVCDYVTSKGCGSFELFDWSDLTSYSYDYPDRMWADVATNELEEYVSRVNAGDFQTLANLRNDTNP